MPAYSIKPTVPIINRRLAKLYGVVAAWPFSERGGTALLDVASGGSGVITGATWTAGAYGPCLSFSGSAQYVTAPHNAAYNTASAIAVECWVKPNAGMTNNGIINKGSFASDQGIWSMGITSGKLFALLNNAAVSAVAPATLPAGVWSHIVMTYDRVALCLYINGVLVASTAYSTALSTNSNSVIIGGYYSSSFTFSGLIADARIHNCVPQIAALYMDPWALYRQDRRNVFAIGRSGVPGAYFRMLQQMGGGA